MSDSVNDYLSNSLNVEMNGDSNEDDFRGVNSQSEGLKEVGNENGFLAHVGQGQREATARREAEDLLRSLYEDPGEPPTYHEGIVSSSSQTEESNLTNAKRKKSADPNDPDPRKRPRQSYSEKEKRMIIEAEIRGGRKERLNIAEAIGMPFHTADNLIAKARRTKDIEDVVSDSRHKTASHAHAFTKKNDHYLSLLFDWIHISSELSLKQLTTYVNREILRDILKEHAVELSETEATVNKPLDQDKFLGTHEDVARLYERRRIKSLSTVRNWLDGMLITVKHTISQKTSTNRPDVMERRLKYAKALKHGVDDTQKYVFLFQDEMPWYLTFHKTHGRALKGRRAVTQVPPVGGMAYRTTVAMTVSPNLGLVHSDIYRPEKQTVVQKSGKLVQSLRTTWNKETFKSYMNDSLVALHEKYPQEIAGKEVVIVIDGAPEHPAAKEMDGFLSKLEVYPRINTFLQDSGGSLNLMKAPPNSPQLNLCEYYNRQLRMKGNALRADLEVREWFLQDSPHGQKTEHRLNALEQILKKCLHDMHKQPPHHGSVVRLLQFADDVIMRKGYLDFSHPM